MSSYQYTAAVLCASGLLLLGTSGCSSRDLGLVPVSGRVTFNGGSCPANGSIDFIPTGRVDGVPQRAGYAEFDTDGEFQVRTFEENDGLLPGEYRLNISCWKRPPTAQDHVGESFLPKGYLSKSPETYKLSIAPDQTECEVTIDVK